MNFNTKHNVFSSVHPVCRKFRNHYSTETALVKVRNDLVVTGQY